MRVTTNCRHHVVYGITRMDRTIIITSAGMAPEPGRFRDLPVRTVGTPDQMWMSLHWEPEFPVKRLLARRHMAPIRNRGEYDENFHP